MVGYINGVNGSSGARKRPARADTLDLKQKLAVALGENGTKYWQTFVQFCKGAIDRSEFEELAHRCLKSEHVHLHNSLILGILYNASADVPGPSSRQGGGRTRVRRKLTDGTEISEEETDDEEPSKKRLRTLMAGLPKKERLRLKNLEHASKLGTNSSGGALSLGWAGSAADMLEKKRKEEEKRKVAEDRRKVREVKSAIGARDWRGEAIHTTAHVNSIRGKLSMSTQQSLARAMVAPLCVESKQLPDLDGIRDRMTLLAVENGMPGGVQSQAAAMVLSALQDHLQNVASSVIAKVRANRPNGIRIAEPQRPASEPTAAATYSQDGYRASPAHISMELDESTPPSAQSSPVRHLRSLQSDMFSRTSIGTSFADSSMLSLASTAPTSLAGPSSPSIRDGELHDTFIASQGDGETKPSLNTAKGSDSGTARLTLADMAFLLELAPHTVIEPLGQGTQERLLAPDWNEDVLSPDHHLISAAKSAATSKLSDSSVRSRFVIDQSAPLRLLDRTCLVEKRQSPEVLKENNGRRHRDDMWDVVDPVALFGMLVD